MGDSIEAVEEELWLAGCKKEFTAEDAKAMLDIVKLLRVHSVPVKRQDSATAGQS